MIVCPTCQGEKAKVIDCRNTSDGGRRKRMRCPCGYRFTTAEIVVDGEIYFRQKETATMALKRLIRDTAELKNYTETELLKELLRRKEESNDKVQII